MRAGGASGRRRFIRALGAVAHRNLAGREIHDRRWNKERRYLARAAFDEVRVLAFDDVESADSRTDVHAYVFRILRRDLKAGGLHSFIRGGDGEVNEPGHLAGFFFLNELERIEVLDLGGDLTGVLGSIEVSDPTDAAVAGQQVLPDFLGGVADRADQAYSSDDNSPHQLFTRLGVLADIVDRVLNGADFFGVLVGDFDLESFFESHDQFDGVERVGAQVVHERSAGGHFALVHSQLFHDDLLHFFINGCHVAPRSELDETAGAKGNPNCLWSYGQTGGRELVEQVSHGVPRTPSTPSFAMTGVITKAETGSAHHRPKTALRANPPSKMADK